MNQLAMHTTENYLRASTEINPQALAILAPGRIPLTYGRLYAHAVETARVLNELGIGRNDRVAIAIPSSAEGGIACICVEMVATSVPLNPAYSLAEFVELMSRLKVKAVILAEGSDTAAWQAAEQLNLTVITLIPLTDQEAGLFRLSSRSQLTPIDPDSEQGGYAQPTDILRLALTSGTTAAAKAIPVSQKSFCVHVYENARFIELTPQDRLLCFMPMFHSAGTFYTTLALITGGSACILPGFEVKTFFQSLGEFKPTWFPAVTTIFQLIIDQAPHYPDILAEPSLRCIVALSMAIDTERSIALEAALHAPVTQFYGTTESGSISANPLPPRHRKLGSAGVPLDSEIRMIDDNLQTVPRGETGEIVVRGPTVMEGYDGDPEGTAAAFVDGWYRTGDLGYFDSDDFLFIVGRVKEVINRGGQKVSPGEVEQALLAHPAVSQAVVFAIPDPKLGDEVGAAVVAQAGSISEAALRAFVADRLAPYKIPRRIAFLEDLPKTAVGKPQRLGMAQKLGWTTPASDAPTNSEDTAPRTDTEKELARLWSEVLGRQPSQISVNARFADLGGSSLNATQLIFKARAAFNVLVTILDFFDAPTITLQAAVIEALRRNPQTNQQRTNLIPIQPNGSRPPVFCLHALHGGVYIYQRLLPFLPDDQPVYGLQAVGMDGLEPPLETIEAMALRHVQEIRAVQTKGPYYLCGYSMGGRLAIEVARLLRDQYAENAYVFCIDDKLQHNQDRTSAYQQGIAHTRNWPRLLTPYFVLRYLPLPFKLMYLRQRAHALLVKLHLQKASEDHLVEAELELLLNPVVPPEVEKVVRACQVAADAYVPMPYDGPITYLHAADNEIDVSKFMVLRTIARGKLDLIAVPGRHGTLLLEPNVSVLGEKLTNWLAGLQ